MLLVVLRPPRVNVDIFHKNFPAMFIVLTSLLVNVGVSFTSTYANETIDFLTKLTKENQGDLRKNFESHNK